MAGAYARMKRAGGAPVDPNATGDEFGQDDILAMAQKRLQQNLPASIGLSKGDTVSTSEAGPASTADIMRLLDIAGIKNDGSKIDLKPYMSKRQPDLESLKQLAATRPTEVSLRGLDQIANALSSTDRKVKFEAPGQTADKSLADWTALGDAIQGERDNDFKKQQDLFKAISGITSQRGSSSSRTSDSVNFSIPQAPRGAGGPKKRNPTAGEIQQLSEARSALDAVDNILDVVKKNKDIIGPVAGKKYSIGRGQDAGFLGQAIAMGVDKLDPNATRAATVRAAIDLVRQQLAKPTEGGVLREADEAKYRAIIGDMTRDPDAILADLQNFRKELANRGASRIDLMNSSNINMGPEYKAYTEKFTGLKNTDTQIPGQTGLKKQVNKKTGEVRYVDANGNVVKQ